MAYQKAPAKNPLLVQEKESLYIEDNFNVQKESTMPSQPTSYGLSSLRANLFQIADAALQSGEPVPLERNGQRLWLVPERQNSRIDRLPMIDIIVGNPDDLISLNVSEWDESRHLI